MAPGVADGRAKTTGDLNKGVSKVSMVVVNQEEERKLGVVGLSGENNKDHDMQSKQRLDLDFGHSTEMLSNTGEANSEKKNTALKMLLLAQ